MRLLSAAILMILSSAFAPRAGFAQGTFIPEYPEKKEGKEEQSSRFRPGIQGGLNVSTYSTNPNVRSSSRVGYILGGELEVRLNPTWYLQQEIRIVEKGFSYDLVQGLSVTTFDVRVQYLEIPLMVKAKFMQGKIIQPFVFFGPNLGFNIGNNVDVTTGLGNYVSGPSLDALFKSTDFSIDGGLGGEYHFARHMAGFLEFRASIGLVNVSDLPGTDWKSRDYQFIFGGLFDF